MVMTNYEIDTKIKKASTAITKLLSEIQKEQHSLRLIITQELDGFEDNKYFNDALIILNKDINDAIHIIHNNIKESLSDLVYEYFKTI